MVTIFQINDVNYNVKVSGTGPAALFLHGFTGSLENWSFLSERLSRNYQVILIDIIGHGHTDSPIAPERYQIEKVADDIYAILDRLHLQSCSLVGYSMGGRVALTFAIRYPEKVNKLLLESSSPGLATEKERFLRRQQDEELANFILTEGIEAFVNKWENIALFASQKQLPENIRQQIRQLRLRNNPLGLANSLKGMGTGVQPSWWEHLSTLHLPALLVVGELDKKFCEIASKMAQKMPKAHIETVAQAGHTVHLEQPEKFGKIMEDWLQS